MSNPGFHPAIDDLAPRVLLDMADDADRTELARLLAASPANRRRFLDHAALHGMLAHEAKAGAFAESSGAFFGQWERDAAPQPRRRVGFWLPAAAAAVVACVAVIMLLPARAAAAVDRVIHAMNEARDRTYQIKVIEPAPDPAAARADRGRFPPANYLDDATLWLRASRGFVLSQSLPNGQTRVIGGDGTQSWSMRGDGPVRVSADPERFGRAIFARNGEIAFLDLRTQLDELKRSYRIEWLDRANRETWKLRGLRRSADEGGPREIELWFNPASGLLERMVLRQLPRGNGGPRSIAVILLSTDPLPEDFFRHASHHEPERTILTEP